jgi:UDP-N-acetylmuramoyl-tripeptide--D-alanyl-D-alanine ligase
MTGKKETLWTSDEVALATGGKATAPFSATGVSIDTRTLKPGDLYVALTGDKQDGHAFVEAAFKAGAVGAMVRKDFKGDFPLVRVDDTFRALQDLGRAGRGRTHARIIGVTGSAGKTGTKEMLATAFSVMGRTHASKKSFNNHWGVPLSLASMPMDTAYGIFEMGMNHTGELGALAQMVRPEIVIITTVEPAHIENFRSMEEIVDAKAEIFSGMEAGGIAILNLDNPHYARLKAQAQAAGVQKILSFGEEEKSDARLIDCTLHADSSRVTADIAGIRVKYRLNIPGKHIVHNSLGALAVVAAAGGDVALAAEAIKNAEPVEGRGNRLLVTLVEGEAPVTIIDESYNANPASMLAAFEVFGLVAPQGQGRRVAVLGDMLELGKDGPRLHGELAHPLLQAHADLVFCCGPQMEALYQKMPPAWQGGHAPESKALALQVAAAVRPGDVVLVKGSAGSKMAYVVEALRALQSSSPKDRETRRAL